MFPKSLCLRVFVVKFSGYETTFDFRSGHGVARIEFGDWREDLFEFGTRGGSKRFAGRESGDFCRRAGKSPHELCGWHEPDLPRAGLPALKGMVGSLDPHSEFLDPDDYQQLQDDTEGQFGGLGLVVAMKDGFVTVVAPMDDSPGFRAGILPGDRIVKINGKSVENLSLEDVVTELRGDPGTQVTITIQRPSTGAEKDFTLTRSIIQMDLVKDINGKKEFPLGPDKIGYVRITEFEDKTGDELEAALQKLQGAGHEGADS